MAGRRWRVLERDLKSWTEEIDGMPFLHLKGTVSVYNALAFKTALQKELKAGNNRLCLVFDELVTIDSCGLGVLINELKAYERSGGELIISGLNPNIRSLFEVTRYDAFFRIFDDTTGACEYFTGATT